MKNLYLFLTFSFSVSNIFAQSNLILPQSATNLNAGHILKTNSSNQGYNHTNGTVGIGTYVSASFGYIQTHTPHSMAFSVNNGSSGMILSYSTTPGLNNNLGIGTSSPQEKLHVVGNIRASSLTGTGVRNVYAEANGNLTAAAQTQTLIVTPQSFQRRYNTGTGVFISAGSYGDCFMFGAGATDDLSASFTLPVGATITGVSFYYTDNDPNHNLEFYVSKTSTTATASSNVVSFFQNTINANPFDISTHTSGVLSNIIADGEYCTILIRPRLLTSGSSGIWNYAGGGQNLMSIKGLKITYTL